MMFQVGDVIRKKNGNSFFKGSQVSIITSIKDDKLYVGDTYVRVNEAVLVAREGCKVTRVDGVRFTTNSETCTAKRIYKDLNGRINVELEETKTYISAESIKLVKIPENSHLILYLIDGSQEVISGTNNEIVRAFHSIETSKGGIIKTSSQTYVFKKHIVKMKVVQ